jgi:hypothetical protein
MALRFAAKAVASSGGMGGHHRINMSGLQLNHNVRLGHGSSKARRARKFADSLPWPSMDLPLSLLSTGTGAVAGLAWGTPQIWWISKKY